MRIRDAVAEELVARYLKVFVAVVTRPIEIREQAQMVDVHLVQRPEAFTTSDFRQSELEERNSIVHPREVRPHPIVDCHGERYLREQPSLSDEASILVRLRPNKLNRRRRAAPGMRV